MALELVEEREYQARRKFNRPACVSCMVKNHAVCKVLDAKEHIELAAITRHIIYQPGQTIVAETEDKEIVGTVISGVIKLTKALCDGREQIVGLLFPADVLGRVRKEQSQVFGIAVGKVEICLFNATKFRQLIEKYPVLREALYNRALNELDSAREWMVLLGRKNAREKIATFLVMLAKRSQLLAHDDESENSEVAFSLPLSRADIADFLGLTIETVSRQITTLKSAGAIDMRSSRDIVVPDLERLQAMAEGEQI